MKAREWGRRGVGRKGKERESRRRERVKETDERKWEREEGRTEYSGTATF